MAYRRIPLSALRVGMHVAKVDRSWLWSPLLFLSFRIKTARQIDKLRRYGIKEVDIDPARGLDIADITDETVSTPIVGRPDGGSAPQTPVKNQVSSLETLVQDLTRAREARQRLEQSIKSTFSTIAATGTVQPDEARRIAIEVVSVTQTLSRPALLMAFSHERDEDPLLSQHALAVSGLSMILAHAADLDLLTLQEVVTGALLHDIGLLQLPTDLRRRCNETSGSFSPSRQQLYRSHPRLAAMALQRQGSFSPAICQMVAEHHALFNNTGFPAETHGAFTSDMTRLMMVADRYDELLTGFGGASPLTPHQALQRLYEEGQGGKYDSKYVTLFVTALGIYPVYSSVRLNTGERAIVTVINSRKLHQPIVTITHDPDGIPYPVSLVIDLANQDERAQTRSIARIIDSDLESLGSLARFS
jgi:HD-GYP domain-containing protein (c-di-GMP phosphodiesterase class II)